MITVRHLLDGKGRALFSIEPEDPVLEAIRMMADRHVGALLVMRGTELAGILSERDYARKVVLLGRSSAETPVWQIMTSPVVTVSPDNSIQDCMRLMTERRIRHLPVVERRPCDRHDLDRGPGESRDRGAAADDRAAGDVHPQLRYSIYDEQFGAHSCVGAVRFRTISHLVTHSWPEREVAAISQLGVEFALNAKKNMTLDAPVVGDITR